jgi:putative pyruvate formate lyase activating enzyme
MIPQFKTIVKRLNRDGYHPIIVYNTNAYDKVDTLKSIENIVDVYLPDFKYEDPRLASIWSNAENYPRFARDAIKEMYRQKGNYLQVNNNGKLERGLIIRHLVLPGATENSLNVLRFLAEEVSNRIAVSLMSQYSPVLPVTGNYPLNRKITPEEYDQLVREMHKLGFTKGWIQEMESPDFYIPDFSSSHPFE